MRDKLQITVYSFAVNVNTRETMQRTKGQNEKHCNIPQSVRHTVAPP